MLFLPALGVSILAFLHQVRSMTAEAVMISFEKLWKEFEVIQSCRKDLVMPFLKKRKVWKTPKNYRPVINSFISGHEHLEDKKTMNMWHQDIVSNSEALVMVSADVQCHTYQGSSMSENDWAVTKGTCTLWAVTVSAHKRGLLVCKSRAPTGPHSSPLPTRILPCLCMEACMERQEKKAGDMICRKLLERDAEVGAFQTS